MSPEVQAFLEQHGAACDIYRHAPLVSFEDARRILPFDPHAMVKCLAFRLPAGGYGLVGLLGADRADYAKIARCLGVRRADLALASPEEVLRDLGMAPGGIAPLPIAGATVVLDERVLRLETVYCGTGRTDATLIVSARELARVSGARSADVARSA